MSPSWEIYERWCFLRVGQLLGEALPAWNWRRLKNPTRWLGSCGGVEGELRLQPTFCTRAAETATMWSISKERVPDLVLTVRQPDGIVFAVLDAKYRASRNNVLDAMESAHIYQDSLRIGSRRPEVSLLLVPSPGGADWLEQPTFHSEHLVGVHPLSPGQPATLPPMFLRTLGIDV